jgi:hypothetical protein
MALHIKDEPLYKYDVTLAAVSVDGQADEWVFLPFESERCKMFAASPTRLLAISDSGRIRVFDVPSRARLIDAAAGEPGQLTSLKPWAWSELHSTFFTTVWLRPGVALRRIDAVSGSDTLHRLPDFWHLKSMAARDDGSLFVVGRIKKVFAAAIVDVAAGQMRTQFVSDWVVDSWQDFTGKPKWPSWNGKLILRNYLGGVLRDDPAKRHQYDPAHLENGHPDLIGSIDKRFGIALEVYNTWPFTLLRRIALRYVSQAELEASRPRSPSWNYIDFRALDTLADDSERSRRPEQAQFLFTMREKNRLSDGRVFETYTDAEKDIMRTEQSASNLLGMVFKIEWDSDSKGFTAYFSDGQFRHINLDGQIGPLQSSPSLRERLILQRQIKPFTALLRQKTARVIKLRDKQSPSLAAAMARIAAQMQKGLAKMVTNGILGWEFALPDETLPESSFYALVRAASPTGHRVLLPPLQDIFRAYADQIGTVKINGEQLYSLEHEEDDESDGHAALGEAAFALATIDLDAYKLLKPWFSSVDREHDTPTVDRVFAAIEELTGFNSPELAAFRVWFEENTL